MNYQEGNKKFFNIILFLMIYQMIILFINQWADWSLTCQRILNEGHGFSELLVMSLNVFKAFHVGATVQNLEIIHSPPCNLWEAANLHIGSAGTIKE